MSENIHTEHSKYKQNILKTEYKKLGLHFVRRSCQRSDNNAVADRYLRDVWVITAGRSRPRRNSRQENEAFVRSFRLPEIIFFVEG